jgi:hypothetical protein
VPPALRREARAWLFAPPTGAPLSLDLACAFAGVDPRPRARRRAAPPALMARAPREPPPSPMPEPPALVTLRCTDDEAALILRALRTTTTGVVEARPRGCQYGRNPR